MSASGDRLEQLATTIGPRVLTYLARRVSPAEDAADLYSQVLTITWRKLRAVPADDQEALAWMLGVARRCLANHHRGLSRRSALANRLRDDLRTAVVQPPSMSTDDLGSALSLLSGKDQELVTLVYWEELSSAQAAAVLGISAAAARKRLERARGALRRELAGRRPCTSGSSCSTPTDVPSPGGDLTPAPLDCPSLPR